MKRICLIVILSASSGCIVQMPDRFQMGGEVVLETTGLLQGVAGFRFRVFGGIVIEKRRPRDEKNVHADRTPLDVYLHPGE